MPLKSATFMSFRIRRRVSRCGIRAREASEISMNSQTVVYSSKWLRKVLLLVVNVECFSLASSSALAADSGPCSANSESRQLDYWLGNWAVTSPGGSPISSSDVHLSLDQCLFIESWDNGKGHVGENMFAYSPDDKAWYGMFADNRGRVHVFVDGKVASGSAEFRGPSRDANGQAVLNRVRIVRTAPDKVEQT